MVPDVIPDTTPDPDIVATEVFVLLQAPPDVASLRFIVDPLHTVVGPMIAVSDPLIVIATLTVHEPTV